jgi:FYVE, RhoGEF and PH domain containing 5/6
VKATTEGIPLISPGQMASIFSNFVDMLGFHQSFYATLNAVLGPYVKLVQPPSAYTKTSPSPTRTSFNNVNVSSDIPPAVAVVLAQHVPFFSMYTPFVTAYPTIMASLHNLTSPNSSSYSAPFSLWLKEREQDPRCGRLGLRDWLLTLVQRCPRYLLLARDLVNCTETTDPEFAELEEVVKMLEKGKKTFFVHQTF